VNVKTFNEETKKRLVADINNDLANSAKTLTLLPKSSRRAVVAAQLLFTALNKKIAKTPAEQLIRARIRVSDVHKLFMLFKAMIGVLPK
jgi:phytoene/squalene synthetase